MVNRGRFKIMAEILNSCKKPQTKTRVMHNINVSWVVLHKYLPKLKSQGLLGEVEVLDNSTKYVTTRKGLEFIEKWRDLVELIQPLYSE